MTAPSQPRITVVANAASGSAVDAETPRGVDTVVACEGDGTVRAVLEGLDAAMIDDTDPSLKRRVGRWLSRVHVPAPLDV